MKYIGIQEQEQVCANCEHYFQYYLRSVTDKANHCISNSGHCKYPRLKSRKPGQQGCDNFILCGEGQNHC